MRGILFGALVVAAVFASPAEAACAYGNNSLGGAIGPFQSDMSRSYTISGRALLTVAAAVDYYGAPTPLSVTFPQFCKTRVGSTVACAVAGEGDIFVIIQNTTNKTVTYNWVCSGL